MQLYERDQVLWVRLAGSERATCQQFELSTLRAQYAAEPDFFTSHWNVENACGQTEAATSAVAVLGAEGSPTADAGTISQTRGAYYVSCILQSNEEGLARFFQSVPFAEPRLLEGATHDDGVWLFVGSNPAAVPPNGGGLAGGKKRKQPEAVAITGRPEHTDAVSHSGTWHVQLSGTKTWFIRPLRDEEGWEGTPPDLDGKEGAFVDTDSKVWRLRIDASQGDLLLVNTRMWWHCTEIPPQCSTQGWSISCARDFVLGSVAFDDGSDGCDGGQHLKTNDNTLHPSCFASRNVAEGEVALSEDDFPSTGIPRASEPNCRLAEIELASGKQADLVSAAAATTLALVATCAISEGEVLTVRADSDDEYEEWELDETNALSKVNQ